MGMGMGTVRCSVARYSGRVTRGEEGKGGGKEVMR